MDLTELEQAEQVAREAQYLAEQKAGDAASEWDRIHEQLAETRRELAGFPARVRAVDSDNDKALGRLASERAALEVKRDALVARAERAEKAHQEAVEALAVARVKLQEAEDAHQAARCAQAERSLDELIESLREPARPHLATAGYSNLESFLAGYLQRMQERKEDERRLQTWRELPLQNPDGSPCKTRAIFRGMPGYDEACLELAKKQERERKEIERYRREKKPTRAAEGVEVVELPDGSRVVDGVVLRSLGHPEMSYRIAHELNKQDEEAHRNLGGDDP